MEGEISNCLMVWTLVVASLCYCHSMAKFIPSGSERFFFIVPVTCLFFLLPLKLSTICLGGLTSFFIAWLCNFKLLLFAFGQGPLYSCSPLPLSHFVLTACLPIKAVQSKKEKGHETMSQKSENGLKSSMNYIIKFLVSVSIWTVLIRRVKVHPMLFNAIFCVQVYVSLELSLAILGALAQALIKVRLEPQFNEPYLSTSLQDFWGRRWNLMVANIMHPTVYVPVRSISTLVIGRKWAALPAAFCSFLVSALMHELIFFYIGRKKPTGVVSSFFLLHGVCVAIEIGLKKFFATKFHIPRVVSTVITVGFILATGLWLFIPALLYCGAEEMGRNEMMAVKNFMGDLWNKISRSPITAASM